MGPTLRDFLEMKKELGSRMSETSFPISMLQHFLSTGLMGGVVETDLGGRTADIHSCGVGEKG